MLSSLRRSVARIGRWPRLAAAGVCLLLAAASALGPAPARRSTAAAGVPVVVATRGLPTGYRLTRADLAVVRWPAALRPPGARADPAGLVGSRLATPLGRHEAVTASRVIGPGLLVGQPAGAVATVVVVDQDVGSLIRAGDRVDLLAAPRANLTADATPGTGASGHAVELARGLVVLAAVPTGADTDVPGVSVVLSVSRATALRIAGLRPVSTFSVVGDWP